MSWLLLRLVISMHGLNMKGDVYFDQKLSCECIQIKSSSI